MYPCFLSQKKRLRLVRGLRQPILMALCISNHKIQYCFIIFSFCDIYVYIMYVFNLFNVLVIDFPLKLTVMYLYLYYIFLYLIIIFQHYFISDKVEASQSIWTTKIYDFVSIKNTIMIIRFKDI